MIDTDRVLYNENTRIFYYNDKENPKTKHKVEVQTGDIVKINHYGVDPNDTYAVGYIEFRDLSHHFGTCVVSKVNSEYMDGFESMPIGKLIFVDRDFIDPDEHLINC